MIFYFFFNEQVMPKLSKEALWVIQVLSLVNNRQTFLRATQQVAQNHQPPTLILWVPTDIQNILDCCRGSGWQRVTVFNGTRSTSNEYYWRQDQHEITTQDFCSQIVWNYIWTHWRQRKQKQRVCTWSVCLLKRNVIVLLHRWKSSFLQTVKF